MQSTTSDEVLLTGPVGLKPGDKVRVDGSDGPKIGTVLESESSSSSVKLGNWTAPRPPRNGRMTAHRQLGHSFWPRRDRRVHYYECCRCGMEKPPGTRVDMDCQNYLRYKVVKEVHDF
jgi:hypothetical protein